MKLLPATSIVIDANLAVYEVISCPPKYHKSVETFWQICKDSQIRLYAPYLWVSETTSVVRFLSARNLIQRDAAWEALEIIADLGVRLVPEDILRQRAYVWAEQLGQARAYDAFYLALAEHEEIDFWTAEEKLYNRCQQLGISWVKWVGEK